MHEIFSGKIQSEYDSAQTDKSIKQKLEKVSGETLVNPSVFGITPEGAKNIHEQFKQRVKEKTDVGRLLKGIIPEEGHCSKDSGSYKSPACLV